jgi:hypothetical protein
MNDENIGNRIADLTLDCPDCRLPFTLTIGEQLFSIPRSGAAQALQSVSGVRRARRETLWS